MGKKTKHLFKKKINNKLFFGFLLFFLLICAVTVYSYASPHVNKTHYSIQQYFQQVFTDWQNSQSAPEPNERTLVPINANFPPVTLTPLPTLVPITSEEYKSNSLGISFYYASFIPNPKAKEGGQRFFVRKIDNTIYFYWVAWNNQAFDGNDQQFLSEIAPDAKYIKVFYKNPQQSLTDAIKQHIFQSPLPGWCYISTDTPYGEPNMNTSYQQAVILEYPSSKTKSYQENTDHILSCTPFAGNYEGKSYFLMNPSNPDRFVYVKDGQDDIPSGYHGYMWDGTITIN